MKSSGKKILIVDDEEDLAEALFKILKYAGYEPHIAKDGQEALQKARQILPELVLLDVMLPVWDGKAVKRYFNEEEALKNIPVIFLTAKSTLQDKVEGLHLGEDYVTKPFEAGELLARIEGVLSRKSRYEEATLTDELTGLGNARAFTKQLENLFNIAKRYRRVFSLAMMDIDNLKKINDAWGHAAGTAALKMTADTMKEVFRQTDILIRYGGDEFVVLFPECGEEQAAQAVARFQAQLSGKKVSAGSSEVMIAVSAGVAVYQESIKTPQALFQLADQKMYQAKERKNLHS